MKANDHFLSRHKHVIGAALGGLGLLGVLLLASAPCFSQTESFIVQGPDLESAKSAVLAVGGEVTHELKIIGAVGAQLTEHQRRVIEADEGLHVRRDNKVEAEPAESEE